MKAMGMFISTLLVVDTFLVSYYLGMHSRSVAVEDPSMKPVLNTAPTQPPKTEPKAPAPKQSSHPGAVTHSTNKKVPAKNSAGTTKKSAPAKAAQKVKPPGTKAPH